MTPFSTTRARLLSRSALSTVACRRHLGSVPLSSRYQGTEGPLRLGRSSHCAHPMAARKLSGGQALTPATPRLPETASRAGLVGAGARQHLGSVTAGTAGRRCGRHRWDGWATKQRPAGREDDMATTPNLITRATRKQALEERGLIRSQMRLGAGLIALGALSIPLFQVSGVLEGQAATAAFAVATAVIGAGAAMLPTGAPQAPAPPSCGRS